VLGGAVPQKGPQEEVAEKIRKIIEQVKSRQTDLRILVDSSDHDVIVRIISRKSGELVRQIPTEEMVDLQKKLDDLKGLIFHKAT